MWEEREERLGAKVKKEEAVYLRNLEPVQAE
jgi:hypothetical protein